MSNPLLRPDERLRRAALTDAEGRSLFADDAQATPTTENVVDANSSPLQSPNYTPGDNLEPNYQPQYETILPHRADSLLLMSLLGFLFTFGLVLPFFTIYAGYGIILGFLGVMLSVIAALQTFQELTGMSRGAIDNSGRNLMIIAYCLSMSGVVMGIGVILWVVVLIYRGVMDLNL